MNVLNKLHIDYKNIYTIKKALQGLEAEFYLALKKKNKNYAETILNAIKHICNNFIVLSDEGVEQQKYWIEKMQNFLIHSSNKLKKTLGAANDKIKHTIRPKQ